MKSFLNILLLLLVMGYSVETVYALPTAHAGMDMECCENPEADHSCCDDHEKSDNHCSDSGCDCVMISNVLEFNNYNQPNLNFILSYSKAKFPHVIPAFDSPIFPIWTPPDIA